MTKDPVCGMTIEPTQATARVDYGGKTYYFCSAHCQRTFQADPKKYAALSLATETARRVPRMRVLATTLAAAAAASFALAAAAQSEQKPVPRAGHEVTAPVTSHHQMQSLMREMSRELDHMTAQMGEAASPEARQRVAGRMQQLSSMLEKMSGLLARPAHGSEERAQLDDMRRRLQALSAAAGPAPRLQPAAGVDERMARLESDLDELDAQMERIRAAANPAERSRLLGEHARALRQSMAAVRELGRAFSPQMRAMMGGGTQAVSAERMMLAHDLMARRIALMERLTQQVMEQSMSDVEGAPRSK